MHPRLRSVIEAAGARSPARREFTAAILVTLGVVFLFRLRPVPFSNELLYLLFPYHLAHPDFLPGDWTLDGYWDHALFALLVSLPMRVLSLETVGWIGRIVTWVFLAAGLLRLMQQLGIRPIVGALLIGFWIATGTAPYGGEGIFFGFEAKEPAYVLLFWGLERVMDGKEDSGALLLGLTFVLHASVGASVGVAAAVAFAVAGGRRDLARRGGALAIGGVLGAIAIAPVLVGEAVPPDMWKVMTYTVLPMHFNASSFGRWPVILSYGMLLFNILSYRAGPRDRGLRFLIAFQCTLGVLTLIGLVAYQAGAFGFLRIYPFRVFPLLVQLFFLISLVRAFQLGQFTPANRLLSLCAVVVLWNYGHGLQTIPGEIRRTFASWHRPADDLTKVMMWIRANTAPTATVVAPPWRKDAFYLTGRPQVVSFHFSTSDRLAQWRERNERLIGPLAPMRQPHLARMRRFYNSLSVEALRDIRRRYGGDYLISEANYPLPKLYSEGTYAAYDLRGLGSASPLSARR